MCATRSATAPIRCARARTRPRLLARFRRHALIGSYVAAAFITPGDAFFTSVILTVPLYLLYELSIVLSWLVFRKRQQADAATLHDDGVPA